MDDPGDRYGSFEKMGMLHLFEHDRNRDIDIIKVVNTYRIIKFEMFTS
jgi:hypothetical protein